MTPTVSIILPCLNEAETLAGCIKTIQETLRENNIDGEIIMSDNGSTDESITIASKLDARIVQVPERGYGSALMGGIDAAKGTFIVMGDADGSYDFRDIPQFIKKLNEGYDLVMGNRFRGGIQKGAMPWSHRMIGNPLLSGLGKLFFRWPISDAHCGLRAFRRDAYEHMNLRSTGMEFASEMIVKATLLNLSITEIPTTLKPDGRSRPPHLRSFRDGWRHLKFLLLFSPRWLFFYPGLILELIGLIIFFWLLPGPRTLASIGMTIDIHTLLVAAMAILVGEQLMAFALFARAFADSYGYHPPSPLIENVMRFLNLERGIVIGIVTAMIGLILLGYATWQWGIAGFGTRDPSITMRIIIPGTLLILLGIQTIFTSFFLSILTISRDRSKRRYQGIKKSRAQGNY